MFDAELDHFKTGIDLRSYAAGQGYQLDARESSKAVSMMRHPATNDKIAVKCNINGHYIYCSNRDGQDNGTIIDFVQNRQRISLGAVRKELRPWIGQPPVPVPAFAPLRKTARDHAKVELEYSLTRVAHRHPYLENERDLPASLLSSPRFDGRIRIDDHKNAIFPHEDAEGLCGFEKKNREFTGFSSGGTKGLFLSHEFPTDRTAVFGESGIDVLSHAVLYPDEFARYISIGGKPNPEQPALIRSAILRIPLGGEVVDSMDNDADGALLGSILREAYESSGRGDLRYRVQDMFGFKDPNDQLRAKRHSLFSYRPEVPSVG